MDTYSAFLASKQRLTTFEGLEPRSLPARLFPFQRQVTTWALARGHAALFLDTGLGKTACQLAWAAEVAEQKGDVLILAPLAVAQQTQREGQQMGIEVTYCRSAAEVRAGINITNYERLHLMPAERFAGVALDESSILKALDGKTRTALTAAFCRTPYRLCCTATPAPNDYMELGNHAEFLGIMTHSEMLATYFVHDGGHTSKWRLKGHAQSAFWQWVASWAIALTHPRMLGDETPGFDLPPLEVREHPLTIDVAHAGVSLFPMEARTLTEQRTARKAGLTQRVNHIASLVTAEPDEPWVIWADLNAEADLLEQSIPGAVQIAGRHTMERKEERLLAFASGELKVLVSKASITGYGLNWQHAARMAFVGVGHSFESWYQAIRREWRFGQQRPVHVHMAYATIEAPIVRNLKRKEAEAQAMQQAMTQYVLQHRQHASPAPAPIASQSMELPDWLGRSLAYAGR